MPAPTPAPGGGSITSPLSPPVSPNLTQAVQLTAYGNSNGVVARTGSTLFGAVQNPGAYDIVTATIEPSGRVTTVDVGPVTGQFAVRLFAEDFENSNTVTVTIQAGNSGNGGSQSQPVQYSIDSALPTDGVSQALTRMTYGATPQLYAEVRAMGFQAFVQEQMNPTSINDSSFNNSFVSDFNSGQGSRNAFQNDLVKHILARATYTERQFQEVMGNFWANHFHAINKGTDVFHTNFADREYFRENAFGKFEDLLMRSAKSPLMSQYLDNNTSKVNNINENYGREILELHTVSVNSTYGDEDIIAVSEVFTGWNYDEAGGNQYAFEFRPDDHDPDDKYIPFLDITIPGRSGAAGVQEGEELIAILSQHPDTINHVCGKLTQLLVADNKPQTFVDACAQAWASSDGTMGDVIEAIVLHPAFIGTVEYQRNKVKTPFEFVVSAMRFTDAFPDGANNYDRIFGTLKDGSEDAGFNMMYFPAPTGLPEVSAAWSTSGTFLELYDHMELAPRDDRFGVDTEDFIEANNLETAEEVVSYLLTIATADRFTQKEFEELVALVKGSDGIFEPLSRNENVAVEKLMIGIMTTPSFLRQ